MLNHILRNTYGLHQLRHTLDAIDTYISRMMRERPTDCVRASSQQNFAGIFHHRLTPVPPTHSARQVYRLQGKPAEALGVYEVRAYSTYCVSSGDDVRCFFLSFEV